MDPNEEIKLVAKLAEPIDGATYAQLRGISTAEAESVLGQLQAMSWLTCEWDSARACTVYRLSDATRSQLSAGGFG